MPNQSRLRWFGNPKSHRPNDSLPRPREPWTLEPGGDHSNLNARSVRSAAITTSAQLTRLGIQFIGTVILARILSPADYGLLGMAMMITGFLSMFADFGLSSALIQRKEISHAQISALFVVNVVFGAGLTLLTLVLSPAIGWVYREPRLAGIACLLSPGFLIGSLGLQHQTLLRREMRFGVLAAIEITAIAVATILAVTLATCGSGYWALVCSQLALTSVSCALFWCASSWRPGRPASLRMVAGMLLFGGNLTAFSFASFFARNLDNALIGWRWGASALGIYSKAYQLMLLPVWQMTDPITNVAISALSRLQGDPIRHRRYYLKAIRAIGYVTMPGILIAAVLADEIIPLLLGQRWIQSVRIFRILALGAVFQPVLSTTSWLYISLGMTKAMAKWGILSSAVIVSSFLIGLSRGAAGVATCYSVAIWLLTWPTVFMATKISVIHPSEFFAAVLRPLSLALFCASTVLAFRSLNYDLSPLQSISCSVIAASAAAALSVGVLPWLRSDLNELRKELTSTLFLRAHQQPCVRQAVHSGR